MSDEIGEMREFFRRRLGDDWEIRLILANAIASREASIGDVYAAQQRAAALVTETSHDSSVELRELAAEAWRVLWFQ